MQMLLHLIIVGISLFPNEEPLESVSNIVSVISDLAVVEAEAVEAEAVETEVVETEVVDTEVVDTEVVDTEVVDTEVVDTEVVEQNTSDVDQLMARWAQLDPSTRVAILMLVEADRMTHAK